MKNKLLLFLKFKRRDQETSAPQVPIRDHEPPPPQIPIKNTVCEEIVPPDLPLPPYIPKLVGLTEIESFFLDLYRRQLGGAQEEKGLITWTQDKNYRSGRIYKLSVKHKGQWQSRRMTIRPIGEISHSKSQCFYVIFDTHMVVKIPPAPIKNFSDYISRIQNEKTLVDKLVPRVCVIPNVSVILSRIQKLAGAGAIPAKSQDEKFIRFLKAAPEHQICLKIGGAFAFFMDLSRHFFLSSVLADLHNVDEVIQKTIASDVAMILQGYDFENQYGSQNAQICLTLQDMYSRFESGLTLSLIQPDECLKISEKQKGEWFIAHLTGDAITRPTSPELSDALLGEIKRLLQATAPLSDASVKGYQQIVREHAAHLVFHQNQTQFEEMITNLLELLVFLEEKRVSLRDLKPDNLLIAGNKDNYPLFLLSADDYSIGLIDLETAIDFESSDNHLTIQPHLAGTPAYATPSHFILNPLIQECYGNLPWIFHLQDWHATVGIIYEIVTGHRLFLRTGSQIPLIIQTLQKARANQRDLKEAFWALNSAFWKSARAEFTEKIKQNEPWLNKVMARVPATLKEHFMTHLSSQPSETDQPFLLSDRPDDFRFTLSIKKLLENMFNIVIATMDRKDLFHPNGDEKSTKTTLECENSELMTRTVGLTLTGELLQK